MSKVRRLVNKPWIYNVLVIFRVHEQALSVAFLLPTLICAESILSASSELANEEAKSPKGRIWDLFSIFQDTLIQTEHSTCDACSSNHACSCNQEDIFFCRTNASYTASLSLRTVSTNSIVKCLEVFMYSRYTHLSIQLMLDVLTSLENQGLDLSKQIWPKIQSASITLQNGLTLWLFQDLDWMRQGKCS